ncbi:salicylate synthetase [Metarhizium anisopliae]
MEAENADCFANVRTNIPFKLGNTIQVVCAILDAFNKSDYYAYERGDCWHIGIGSRASLHLDPTGKFVTLSAAEESSTRKVSPSFSDAAKSFVSKYSNPGEKVFGFVSFNYAFHVRGLHYSPGRWPLVSLMVPRVQITIQNKTVSITGCDSSYIKSIIDFAEKTREFPNKTVQKDVDTVENQQLYIKTVEQALNTIREHHVIKVIASRAVPILGKVDMRATLRHGRGANTPKRSFSLNHAGFQATGFSPELVLLCERGKILTEPLAGTRACKGSKVERQKFRHELENDPKEIVEHVISVKEAIHEFNQVCLPGTVIVEDLMSVRVRGDVQHLGSRVVGLLSSNKSAWDAFDIAFPSVTASGIPKSPALETIMGLEPNPRELYSGAVLLLEDTHFFEATLVLRTVFQDEQRQWVQVGAGIISQSNPQRELIETCEKLESIGPHVVLDDVQHQGPTTQGPVKAVP